MISLKKLASRLSAKLSGNTFANPVNVKGIHTTMVYRLAANQRNEESASLKNELTLSLILIRNK